MNKKIAALLFLAMPVCANDALDAHNAVRTSVPNMWWDTALEASANAHAEKCVFEHSSNRNNAGENIYASSGSATIPAAVRSWANEKKDYNNGQCAAGKVCGHYTQLIWRSSLLVGCAKVVCPELKRSGGGTWWRNAGLVVCQYKPAGNWRGVKPVEKATSAEYKDGKLTLKYAVIRYPGSRIQPVSLQFQIVDTSPVVFALEDIKYIRYKGLGHFPSYDVGTAKLFIPELIIGGKGGSRAIFQYITGSQNPFLFRLTHF